MPLSLNDLRPNLLATNRNVLYVVTAVGKDLPAHGRIATTARIGKDRLYDTGEPLYPEDLPEFVHHGYGAYTNVSIGDVLKSRAGKYFRVVEVKTETQPCSLDTLAEYLVRETESPRSRNVLGPILALHFSDLQHYEVVQELA